MALPYGLSANGAPNPALLDRPVPYGPICADANDTPPARRMANGNLRDLFVLLMSVPLSNGKRLVKPAPIIER